MNQEVTQNIIPDVDSTAENKIEPNISVILGWWFRPFLYFEGPTIFLALDMLNHRGQAYPSTSENIIWKK